MAGGRGNNDDDKPRAPGWYPDPWSATGTGERYFDGKKWGTSERPVGRGAETVVGIGEGKRARKRRKKRDAAKSARSKSGRSRTVITIVVFVALVAGVWALQQRGSSRNAAVTTDPRPPADRAESRAPLLIPAAAQGGGRYEIMQHQENDATKPVAWDPCRPVHYVVNPNGGPPDGLALVQSAIARAQDASGLQFVYDGPTDEAPTKQRPAYEPARYDKKRWAPVLIAWSDAATYPELAGYIAGLGGAQAEFTPSRRLVYVSGEVVLDGKDLSVATAPDRGEVRAVIMHELGHLIGLDHTDDPTQLMYSESVRGVRDYGPGDRRGLTLLGTQRCAPDI